MDTVAAKTFAAKSEDGLRRSFKLVASQKLGYSMPQSPLYYGGHSYHS